MGKKTIILISPPPLTIDWTPKKVLSGSPGIRMGLLSIGSVLYQQGYRVKILDGILSKKDLAFELNQINPQETLFVGISSMTAQLPSAVKAATIIREKYPSLPIVWGGVHATLFPEETCSDSLVDVVVIGEGEYACLELTEALLGQKEINSIKGIVYKNSEGKTVFTGNRNHHDLDTLPFPNYELFHLDDYVYRAIIDRENIKSRKPGRMLSIHSGMGCPYTCTFCINTTVYREGKYYTKSPYRGKSANRLLDEIEVLIEKYKVDFIDFVDENFFVDKNRFFKFLDGIEERKFKFSWFVSVRANYFNSNYLTNDVIARVSKLGCVMMGIGAESGSQRILDFLKKGITVEQIENAARILNKHRIVSEFSFMIGLPYETSDDTLKTISFVKKLRRIGPYVSTQSPQLYRPIPGGELYNECVKLGFVAPKNIREWTSEKLQASGYLDLDKLPWIQKDNKTILIIRYVTNILSAIKFRWWLIDKTSSFFIKKIALDFISVLFWLRERSDFWRFPIEYKCFEVLQTIKKKLSGSYLVHKRIETPKD